MFKEKAGMKKSSLVRILYIINFLIFILMCAGWTLLCAAPVIANLRRDLSTRAYLENELSNAMILELCSKQLVPSTIGNCNNSDLSINFYQMSEIVKHNIKTTQSYEDVQSIFGKYLNDCKNLFSPDRGILCIYSMEDYNFDVEYFNNQVVRLYYPRLDN
jgi:hypothetical protein